MCHFAEILSIWSTIPLSVVLHPLRIWCIYWQVVLFFPWCRSTGHEAVFVRDTICIFVCPHFFSLVFSFFEWCSMSFRSLNISMKSIIYTVSMDGKLPMEIMIVMVIQLVCFFSPPKSMRMMIKRFSISIWNLNWRHTTGCVSDTCSKSISLTSHRQCIATHFMFCFVLDGSIFVEQIWCRFVFHWMAIASFSTTWYVTFIQICNICSELSRMIPILTTIWSPTWRQQMFALSELDPSPNIPPFWWSRILILYLSLFSIQASTLFGASDPRQWSLAITELSPWNIVYISNDDQS